MKKLWLSPLAMFMVFMFASCADKNAGAVSVLESSMRLKLSPRTDVWPSGVHDAYGIPEYRAGKIVYAEPHDKAGTVYIQTTREELLAYADELQSRGFRFKANELESLYSKKWERFEVFFPQPGGRYALSGYFSFDNDGRGTSDIFPSHTEENASYEENAAYEDEELLYFNLSLCIADHGVPEGINASNFLTELGLPDEAVVPPGAVDVNTPLTITDPPNYIYSFTLPFDHELTEETRRAHASTLIDACAAAADDGQLLRLEGLPLDAAVAKAENLSSWAYRHKGRKIMIRLISDSGYGGSIALTAKMAI